MTATTSGTDRPTSSRSFTATNTTVGLLDWESSAAGFYGGGIRLLGSGTAPDSLPAAARSNSSGTTYLGPADGLRPPAGRWFWLEVHQKLGKTSGSPTLNEVFVDGRLVMMSTEQNRDAADTGQVVRLKYGFVDNASPAGTDSTMLIDRSSITAAQLGAIGAPATPTGLRQVFAVGTVVGFHANSVPGASGYRFYRKQNGVWAQVGDSDFHPRLDRRRADVRHALLLRRHGVPPSHRSVPGARREREHPVVAAEHQHRGLSLDDLVSGTVGPDEGDPLTQINHQFRLAARPIGLPKRVDWEYTEEPVREPGEGEVLVKTLFLSLDPAMRGWMNDAQLLHRRRSASAR